MSRTYAIFSLKTLFLVFFLVSSQAAYAHARWSLTGLVKPRTTSTGLKEPAPCGGVNRTTTALVLQSGSTIDVQFEETINHPGYFRIAFSPNADTGFDQNILVANIPEVPSTRFYTQTITLPDIECSDCTLQLIQVMTDRTPPTNYYSCADIHLTTSGTLPPPVTDTTPPLDVDNFTSSSGDTQVLLNWLNPAVDFSKVLILQGLNPVTGTPVTTTNYNVNDNIGGASVIYSGNDTSFVASGLSNGSQYHFKIFAFDASLNYSTGIESNTTLPTIAENIAPFITLITEQADAVTERVSTNKGNVVIQALVTDNNPSDTHAYDWSMTDNRLIDLDNQNNNFTFDPADLKPGIYTIQLDVIDNGTPVKSASTTVSIEVVDNPASQSGNTSGSGGSFSLIFLFIGLLAVAFRFITSNEKHNRQASNAA